jgi:hypothetical protein
MIFIYIIEKLEELDHHNIKNMIRIHHLHHLHLKIIRNKFLCFYLKLINKLIMIMIFKEIIINDN